MRPVRLSLPGASYRKYSNTPTFVDGVRFASKREADRYRDLCMSLRGGAIKNLRWQVNYPIDVNGLHITTYRADFVYETVPGGGTVVEDVKGMRTDVYKLKAKLMLAVWGIRIVEL